MNKLKNLLLYAGLEKDEFGLLFEDAQAENAKNLKTYSFVATIVFAALAVVNAVAGDLTSINQKHYLLMLGANLLVWSGMRFIEPRHHSLATPLFYVFMGLLYAFSLAITAIHPTLPAVTTIVLLFAVPFLVCDRPIHLVGMTVAATVALAIVGYACKPASVAHDDLWNGMSFAAIAIVAETLQQRTKFRVLSQARKIRMLSETDLLTGVKNRNHFEIRQSEYAKNCKDSLAFLYVDVNGLHELNDTKGHQAGDVMLQAVAQALVDNFGQIHTYRIGGDEFVCLCMDTPEQSVRDRVKDIVARLAAQGYFISAGIASQPKAGLDMTALTSAAEQEMYEAKRNYYAEAGRDRRKR